MHHGQHSHANSNQNSHFIPENPNITRILKSPTNSIFVKNPELKPYSAANSGDLDFNNFQPEMESNLPEQPRRALLNDHSTLKQEVSKPTHSQEFVDILNTIGCGC